MNKDHYVSLEIAKQLQEAGIKFLESETVWAVSNMLNQTPFLTTRKDIE